MLHEQGLEHVETRRNQIDPREPSTPTKRVSKTTAMKAMFNALCGDLTGMSELWPRLREPGRHRKHGGEVKENHNKTERSAQNQLSTPTLRCSVLLDRSRRSRYDGMDGGEAAGRRYSCGSNAARDGGFFFFRWPRKITRHVIYGGDGVDDQNSAGRRQDKGQGEGREE